MHTAAGQALWYGMDETSVLTAFMPLFHVAGMQFSMAAGLFAGAALVLTTRWDKALVPALLSRHRVTHWSAAPAMIADVMADPDFDEGCLATVRCLTGGGASMPDGLAARLEARFGLRVVEGYGLTETISASHIDPPDRPKRQCLGIPFFDSESLVADPETLAPLPPGTPGEILISGPQVMEGYWNAPEADAAAFVQIGGRRWLRTGDLGVTDDEGYFFILDRLKRLVNVSGYKVSPGEVAALLYRHPAVRECCVIAVPDGARGEAVRAVVVLRPGASATADELTAFARGQMAAYKVPRQIVFAATLPRTASNKIDWRRLQDAAREEAHARNDLV